MPTSGEQPFSLHVPLDKLTILKHGSLEIHRKNHPMITSDVCRDKDARRVEIKDLLCMCLKPVIGLYLFLSRTVVVREVDIEVQTCNEVCSS